MRQHSWLRLIDDFNDNEHEFIISNFGDVQTFFEVLKNKDLFHLIDPEADGSEHWQNDYLLHVYNYDKQSFYVYVSNFLSDVEFKDGKVFFVSNNRDELAEVFCDNSKYNSSRDIAEKVLDEDGDFFEPFDNTTDDIYRDVIGELTDKNIQKLGELIVFELKDEQISTETELLENISQEQNHPEFAIIDQTNISRVIDDEETMNYLLDNHLGEMKSNLYSVHHNAYNSSYNDDLWDEVWNELQTYFVGQGSYISKKNPKYPERIIENFEIEIRHFDENIISYLEDNSKYGNSGTLYYQGSYINVLKEGFDCLKLSPSDYPDYRKVDKYINEYFNDYL